jgi:hypothetical protein
MVLLCFLVVVFYGTQYDLTVVQLYYQFFSVLSKGKMVIQLTYII